MSKSDPNVEFLSLVGQFYRRPDDLGRFEQVDAAALTEPYRGLLAHPHHMTVAMERHHHCPVDVQVQEKMASGQQYARRILLARQSDGQVVQFGIMRLNFEYFTPEVRREIESQSVPLGRILIRHNILWEIELLALWRISPGPDMCRMFGIGPKQITFGRTALIRCNQQPAVELLEIVMPEG